jgi:carboxypeptidase family protein
MHAIRVSALALLCAAVAFTQTNRGGISGTVFDPSGAVVQRATVIITNSETNQAQKLTTSEAGSYSAQNLDPVTYRVQVDATGFKRAVISSVKVDTATMATVNVTLEPGNVETQVSVTDEAPIVNAESGALGQTVTTRQIQDAPLFNRSVLDLAVTIPNVGGDVGSENPAVSSGATVPGFNLSINGGRMGSTTILADGVNNTGVGLARAVVSFSPDTVQELTIQTSAYSAEYGQTGGGVINTTTKSGGNRFNGQVYWYNRNPAFAAGQFTTATINRPVPTLKQNQLGFLLGGPVWIPKLYNGHDKTFFFFAVEPRYQRDHLAADSLLPTDAMRDGDFSGLAKVTGGWAPADIVARFPQIVPSGDTTIYNQFNLAGNQLQQIPLSAGQSYTPFSSNTIPKSMLDPVALKALQYLPHAGAFYVNSNGQLVNYFVYRFAKQDETRYTVRIDHNLTANNRLNFRMTAVPAISQKGFGSDVNGNGADYSFSRQLMLADTHTLSPTILNDLRLNYTRGRFSGTFTPQYDIKTGDNLTAQLGLPTLTKGGLPMFAFELNAFGNIGSQGSTLNDNVEERYNLTDIVYVSRGTMSWKFGVDVTHALLNVIPEFAGSGGNYSFRFVQTNSNATSTGTGGIGVASYLLGVPNAVAQRNVIIPYYYRWNSGAAFVQNDWKLRPNLTLNLGLRYSLQLPRTEKYDHQGVFLPDLATQVPLPQPFTLATGQVLTSATVIPFGFNGKGGRSSHITPVNHLDFEPRFGFAWVPRMFGLRQLVVRGGYGISHAPLTGNNRLPNPDFGAPLNYATNSGQVNPNYVMRLSSNPPLVNPISPDQYLNIPSNGLVYMNAINIPGFVVSHNTSTPYVQNWNLTLAWQWKSKNVIETAYVGSKGTHLFMPAVNINLRNVDYVIALNAANVNPDTININDPLGRRDPNGNIVRVAAGTLLSPYMGIGRLNTFYDASANSIRHAAYVSFIHRATRGLTLTANYTFGKSIDDASDASPDKNVLSSSHVDGQVTFGGTRKGDRSVSTFDQTHVFNATFIYDLPFGPGRKFLSHAWAPVRLAAGGWTLAGIERVLTGFPAVLNLADTNQLGDGTHTIRPDILPGVPLLNPLWDRSCPVGNTCEPYLNEAAFLRPVKGQLGNAPRTLPGVRGSLGRYLDFSIQKNFSLGERRRIQFRTDFNNLLNHPVFRVTPNNAGGTDLFNTVSESVITATDYNTWAKFNGKPASTTAEGAALFAQAQQIITASRSATGALPNDFYHVPIPAGFATKDANSFDITTAQGYKLYRLRQVYQNGGQLYVQGNSSRYIAFAVKFFF